MNQLLVKDLKINPLQLLMTQKEMLWYSNLRLLKKPIYVIIQNTV